MLFLFIVLLCVTIYILYYYNSKLSLQKRQFIIVKKQYDDLKNKANKKNNLSDTIIIKYITPQYTSAVIKFKCNLYLYPLADAVVLISLEKDSFVQVQDCAKVNNTLWFEVSIPSSDRINSKGWIEGVNIQWVIDENESNIKVQSSFLDDNW